MRAMCFAVVLAASGSASGQAGPAAFEGEALLWPVRAALEVAPDERGWIGLEEVLARFEEVSDWTILASEETRMLLKHTLRASGPLRAEPERVVAAVEAVLSCGYFVSTLVRADPPRILSVRSLDTTARTDARQDAIYVPVAEVARFADHPALLVETVVSLPNTDVRALSNSLRGLVVDPNTLQIIPAGNGNELVIQGFGRAVADLVEMLRVVDVFSAPSGVVAAPAARAPRVLRAKADATLSGGDETSMTMLELVMSFAEATGQVALLSDETCSLLERASLGLECPLHVPADELQAVVEGLLLWRGFVVTDLLEDPALFTVRSLDTRARGMARQDARFVDAGSLDACAGRPATLFLTVVELPHTDVRALSDALRGTIVDPNLAQLMAVGNSGALVLQGLGRQLVRRRELVELLDAASAAPPEPGTLEAGGGK